MMMKTRSLLTLTYSFMHVTALCLLLTACSKNDDAEPEPEVPVGNDVKTGVYTVANLSADTNATSATVAKNLYYSLEKNQVIPESMAQTDSWDIAFVGIYNSSIAPNNGRAPGTPGFGGPGKAELYLDINAEIDNYYYNSSSHTPKAEAFPIDRALFEQSFDGVKTADNTRFKTDYINLDHFEGSSDGWAHYDFYGLLFPGVPKKSHIVYTYPRTIVVKTAKGKYAKLIIYNIYKDDPADPNRDNKPGYLTFKYAIQMDGSNHLDIH